MPYVTLERLGSPRISANGHIRDVRVRKQLALLADLVGLHIFSQ